jgi:hypothetical protein
MKEEYLWDDVDPSKSSIFVKFNLNQQSQVNKNKIKILVILNFFLRDELIPFIVDINDL